MRALKILFCLVGVQTAAVGAPVAKGPSLDGVKSRLGGSQSTITFVNRLLVPVRVYWIDFDGKRDSRPDAGSLLVPGQPVSMTTTDGAAFVVTDEKGSPMEVHYATKSVKTVDIGKNAPDAPRVAGKRHPAELKAKSKTGGAATQISFVNNRQIPVIVRWIDYEGRRAQGGGDRLEPGQIQGMSTTVGSAFVVTDTDENGLEVHYGEAKPYRVEIGGPVVNYAVPKRKYHVYEEEGRTVYVEKSFFDANPNLAEKAAKRLASNVGQVLSLLPKHAHGVIKSTKLFIMHGTQAPGGGRDSGLEYMNRTQPQLIRSLDPLWSHALVVNSGANYLAQSDFWAMKATLHEMAHSYHLSNWPQQQPDIEAAWSNAMGKGLYLRLPDTEEKGKFHEAAYASVNGSEYFAELSACYFFRINYKPGDRSGLKDYDPKGYEMIRRMWKISE